MNALSLIEELLAAETEVDEELAVAESQDIVDDLVDTEHYTDVLHDVEDCIDHDADTLGNDYYNADW